MHPHSEGNVAEDIVEKIKKIDLMNMEKKKNKDVRGKYAYHCDDTSSSSVRLHIFFISNPFISS